MVDMSHACVGRQRAWVLLPLLLELCSVMCKMSVLVPPCQLQVSVTELVWLPHDPGNPGLSVQLEISASEL